MLQGPHVTPSYGLAFWLEQEVSVFSDIVLTLKQETFRNGMDWQPTFGKRCADCATEYEEAVEVCSCGSTTFMDPNDKQKTFFVNGDKTFNEKANYNAQSLKEVLSDVEHNLNIVDNGYLLVSKSYLMDNQGNILSSSPKEILSIDPRDIRKIHTDDGLPGGRVWVCPQHRDKDAAEKGKRCPVCGAIMQEAYFETTNTPKRYYLKDELLHISKYYPSILYGYPPILKMIDDAMAYHFLEKRTRSYYEKGHPPGILVFPTNNPESFSTFWSEVMEKMQVEPDWIPALAASGESKASATFVKLIEDPNTNTLEVKKEIRERIGSRFGVSLIFQGDTSASGGLNNEGLQITVTNRAVEDGQAIYNEKILPWLCQQFGITDYVLQLNPSEEQDEMAEKERLARDITNARGMWEMGFDVDFVDGEFKFSGKANPSESGSGSFFPMSDPASPRRSGEPEDLERSEPLTKSFVDDALSAIKQGALYRFYEGVNEADVDTIHGILTDGIVNKLSVSSLTESIAAATGLDEARSEMIARTETTAVNMKAREVGWRDEEQRRGEELKFTVSVTHDSRTSDISKRIESRVKSEGNAVSLDRLKQIYKDESTKPVSQGGMGPDWTGWEYFTSHPNTRTTVVRVV